MKKTYTFKGSWFLLAIFVAIVIGEVVAKQFSELVGLSISWFTVAFLCTGLVAVVVEAIYDGKDIG